MDQQRLPFLRDFSIVRLQPEDARSLSDGVMALKGLLLECEDYYPDIRKWYSQSVLSGIADQSRVAYLGMIDSLPVAAAIVRRGISAKFCHLRLKPEVREHHFGDMFFSLMTADVRTYAQRVHFTLPSSLWEARKAFFSNFGFTDVSVCRRQYRRGDEELRSSAPISRVWETSREKLPQLLGAFQSGPFDSMSPLILSVKPKYARAILDHQKTVEIRRRFSEKWAGSRITIYASNPVSGLLGTVTVKSIVKAHPSIIWAQFKERMGCTVTEYESYVSNADQVFALVLEDAKEFHRAIPIETLAGLSASVLHPPQSYVIASDRERGWGRALNIASAIGGLNPRTQDSTSIMPI